MPVANVRSSHNRTYGSNLAYDANRRRLVHGPLQPMDEVGGPRGFWSRLLRG